MQYRIESKEFDITVYTACLATQMLQGAKQVPNKWKDSVWKKTGNGGDCDELENTYPVVRG